jgi:hypothetical protein
MGERRGVYRVWWGKLREKEDLLVDGRVMLQWIVGGGMEGSYLAQVRGRSRAHGTAVMNSRVP